MNLDQTMLIILIGSQAALPGVKTRIACSHKFEPCVHSLLPIWAEGELRVKYTSECVFQRKGSHITPGADCSEEVAAMRLEIQKGRIERAESEYYGYNLCSDILVIHWMRHQPLLLNLEFPPSSAHGESKTQLEIQSYLCGVQAKKDTAKD